MSARDDFWTWISEHDADNAAPLGLLLSAVLREHAHELAEKIRERRYLPPLSAEDGAFNAVLSGAANLIDPEVDDD